MTTETDPFDGITDDAEFYADPEYLAASAAELAAATAAGDAGDVVTVFQQRPGLFFVRKPTQRKKGKRFNARTVYIPNDGVARPVVAANPDRIKVTFTTGANASPVLISNAASGDSVNAAAIGGNNPGLVLETTREIFASIPASGTAGNLSIIEEFEEG